MAINCVHITMHIVSFNFLYFSRPSALFIANILSFSSLFSLFLLLVRDIFIS